MTPRLLSRALLAFSCASLLAVGGCDWMPGKPKLADKWAPASAVADFQTLFNQNCVACHSSGETVGASLSMADPLYLSVIPEAELRKVIAEGVPGTAMPGFSQAAGGDLTDAQVDILVAGILAKKPATVAAGLPPYAAPLGDAALGLQVFGVHCASCHGADGKGGTVEGSVVDPWYLALVSDQYLRTIIIAGRPELGMPSFQGTGAPTPMTNEDISNVVAWLASQRFSPQPPPPAVR